MKNIKKHLLLGFSTFLLGVGVGYGYSIFSSSSKQQLLDNEDQLRRYERTKDKFNSLSEHDFQDYFRLKNLEDKYKKADELLGKMLLILIADFGIKMSDEQVQLAKRAVVHSQDHSPKAQSQSDSQPSRSSAPGVHGLTSALTPGAGFVQESETQWQKAEGKLSAVRDQQDIEAFLKEARISDFGRQLDQSRVLKTPESKVAGCFEGEGNLQDGSDKLWHIKTETEFTEDSGSAVQKLSGRSRIEIVENGKVINRSGNNGFLKNYKKFPGNSSALLVEVSDILFLQIYHLSDRDSLIGNIYKKSDSDEFSFIGTVQLHRRTCP